MGSGKSSAITPYIILLLIQYMTNLIKTLLIENKDIYLVMPSTLTFQSFNTIMKNVLPITNNFEIIKNDAYVKYENSIKLYLYDDTFFKLQFLNNIIDSSKIYVIFDEVDMMANPLTCEFNIPEKKQNLELSNLLIDICKIVYEKIFFNNEIWENETIAKYKKDNKIHKYVMNYNIDIKTIIESKYDNEINKKFESKHDIKFNNLSYHIKENVLPYIFTNQYNYNYGIPKNYPELIQIDYKFKAIPYNAIDSPSMGSEFSDPILTYFLTYICYNLPLDNNNLILIRDIDKKRYLDLLLKKYIDIKNDKQKKNKLYENIKSLFKNVPMNINNLLNLNNKLYFENNFKDIIEYNSFIPFKDYFKNIEEYLIKYYENANNISFNDLLLHRNVQNFVAFTGTAYIIPPKDYNNKYLNFDYNNNNYITRTKIKNINNVLFDNVEKAIKYIIDKKIDNIYVDNDTTEINFMNTILQCINNYNVLIDIGGIFIKYGINQIIDKLKQNKIDKDYILYFTNDGQIIRNIKNNLLITDIVNIDKNKILFYFGNRFITGVDAKKLMPFDAKGLVTVSHNTNLRDFSQGVFRMRDILNKQQIDIIIDNNTLNKINQKGGTICQVNTVNSIKAFIYDFMKKNQTLIDKNKEKLLYKQNILALCKKNTTDGKIKLYNDPATINDIDNYNIDKYNIKNKLDSIGFNKYIRYEQQLNNFNVSSPNLINLIKFLKKILEDIFNIKNGLDEMFIKYQKLDSVNVAIIHENQQQEQEEEEEQEQEEQEQEQQKQIIMLRDANIIKKLPDYIDYNLNTKQIGNNKIVLLRQLSNAYYYYYYCIIYNDINKNIVILTVQNIKYIFEYNNLNFFDNFTIISFNNKQYGKKIDESLMKIIIIISKEIIRHVFGDFGNEYSLSIRETKLKKTEQYNELINTYSLFTKQNFNDIEIKDII
jgi:hypothetical protein